LAWLITKEELIPCEKRYTKQSRERLEKDTNAALKGEQKLTEKFL
jgi:hypothetical protein